MDVARARSDEGTAFYRRAPVIGRFADIADAESYVPLPPGWLIGVSDVVQSREAIAQGRYKTVNTAGAALIAAMANALGGHDFFYAFGGDGSAFAIAPDRADLARAALAATATFVREELDLALRVALVPVEAIRAAGHDVRVAHFAPSPDVTYALFSGGGLADAERMLKSGDYAVAPAPAGTRPDLTGLSCRFDEIASARGVILSLIIAPQGSENDRRFRAVIDDVVALIEASPEAVAPISEDRLRADWPPKDLDMEARALTPPGGSRMAAKARLALHTLFAAVIFRTNANVGAFSARRYKSQLVANTDFRKYGDGLRMTIDCTPAFADALERRLAAAADVARAGVHRQTGALITCIVPSALEARHFHFVDGASGGYASAATAMAER